MEIERARSAGWLLPVSRSCFCEVVLIATGTRGHRDENRGRSSAGDRGRITKNRKIRGTAVSKLHGRAPNPRARQRGARAPVEVGDFPFLESIFMIFGNVTGLFPVNDPLRASSRGKGHKLPKSPPKTLTKYKNDPKSICRQPPRARGPSSSESGGPGAVRGSLGVVTQSCELFGVSPVGMSLF